MFQFKKFKKLVINLNKELHTDLPDTVAIAGLYYPPQLTWHPDNPTPPPNHKINKMKKFVWLNAKIKELNNLNDRPIYPSFHKHGVRKGHQKIRGQLRPREPQGNKIP